jgi:hypothetical protein
VGRRGKDSAFEACDGTTAATWVICGAFCQYTIVTPKERTDDEPAEARSPMTCEIRFEERPDYLYVVVTGDNSIATIREYTEAVRNACIRARKLQVLVVVNLVGPELSMLDVYKAVGEGSDQAAGMGMRVAYVDLNPTHSIDNMLLAEDVAGGRGIPVRTFREERAAEEWLLTK